MDLWRGSVDPVGMRPNSPQRQQSPSATSARANTGSVPNAPVMPRLLSFYRDVLDDAGTVTGWQTIAWGLAFGDGSVVSTPVGPPISVTLWPCLEAAATALDAFVDTPDLRRTIDGQLDVHPLPRSSTAPSPLAVEDAAALAACPVDPTTQTRGRDRPSGAIGPPAEGSRGGGA